MLPLPLIESCPDPLGILDHLPAVLDVHEVRDVFADFDWSCCRRRVQGEGNLTFQLGDDTPALQHAQLGVTPGLAARGEAVLANGAVFGAIANHAASAFPVTKRAQV